MSSSSSTSLNSQSSIPKRGSRAAEATYNGLYTAATGNSDPFAVIAQTSSAEYWARTIDDLNDQVQAFKEKIRFLESQLESIRASMQQRRAEKSLPNPPATPLFQIDPIIASSPPGYGALSPAPPSINQQPSRYQGEGDFLYCVRPAPLSSSMIRRTSNTETLQEVSTGSGTEGSGKALVDRWAYEAGVDHSTFSSLMRDGASE